MSDLETRCPRCGYEHPSPQAECAACGVIFAKIKAEPSPGGAAPAAPAADLGSHGFQQLLVEPEKLFIEQHHRHWWEILMNLEQRNEYSVMDPMRRQLGTVVEQGTGLGNALVRIVTGSHRPFEIAVVSPANEVLLELERSFFILFSSMDVKGPTGRLIGRVHRRFGVVNRRYDLEDASGRTFAQIVSRHIKIWTFPVVDASGNERGMIAKKWSGLGREYFTDADSFGVDFGVGGWTAEQRAVIFGAAIAIDFDFFENNQKR
jgi:uncharacterized protein YxjI